MKTLLLLTAAVATLCLSACDSIGYKSRHNNTGPGGAAGPDWVWGPRLESSLTVKERRELEASRRVARPAATTPAAAAAPTGT
jgi:hypothetical protein